MSMFPSLVEQVQQRPIWEQAILSIRWSNKQSTGWQYLQASKYSGTHRNAREPQSVLPSNTISAIVTAHNPMANQLGRQLTPEENANRNVTLLEKVASVPEVHEIRPAFACDADDTSDYAEHGLLVMFKSSSADEGIRACHGHARSMGQAAIYVLDAAMDARGFDSIKMRVEHCFDGLYGLASNELSLACIDPPPMGARHEDKAESGIEQALVQRLQQ